MLGEQLRLIVPPLYPREHQDDLVRLPDLMRRLIGLREHEHLARCGEVFELREHHQRLLLRDVPARARDDTSDDDDVVVDFLDLGEVRRHDVAKLCRYLLQGVLRDVDAEELLLPREQLLA